MRASYLTHYTAYPITSLCAFTLNVHFWRVPIERFAAHKPIDK